MKTLIVTYLVLLSCTGIAQKKCKYSFANDSCSLQNPNQKELVDLMQVKIKNNYSIQLIKHGVKKYLKIIVQDDLGFGQTGSLLIYSNKKQYFIKSATLYVIDKSSGYFLLDLNSNYLTTIKDYGLTSIIFQEKVQFTIPKQDSEAVKELANCFSETIEKK